MRAIKTISFKGRKKYAIVVDGDCEFWYFQMLKRNNRDLPVDLKPEIPQKKRLSDQFAKILEYANIYDKVIWIVDMDVVNDETKKAKKNSVKPIDLLKSYVNKLNKYENVSVIINNPCLEYWLLLHFEYTNKFFTDCNGAEKQLKKHLPNYSKTADFYTSLNQDIFLKLKPNLKTAIANSKKTGDFSFDNTKIGLSEMHKLFEMPILESLLQK